MFLTPVLYGDVNKALRSRESAHDTKYHQRVNSKAFETSLANLQYRQTLNRQGWGGASLEF